jgi:flagellar hook-associated protein 1 FlgK
MMMAVQSVLANQGALEVTTDNIANANTPGYTRKRPVLVEGPPALEGNLVVGTGVRFQGIQSIRDRLIEFRINDETAQQARADSQLAALQQVENQFSSDSSGISADMTAFFNAVSQLSLDPSSASQRQAVLTKAQNVADSFHNSATLLNQVRANLNLSVGESVQQVNALTQKIAELNGKVDQMQKLGQEPGGLEDQRVELIKQLSGLIDVNTITTEHGDTLTTGDGTALVVGGQSFSLQLSADSAGMQRVMAFGQDITASIKGGKLAGALNVRDQVIPDLQNKIDTLASDFASAINTAHRSGFDLNGAAGGDLFSVSSTVAGSASSIGVAINSTDKIAASSDGSAGSSGNCTVLTAVQNQKLSSGANALESYSNIVFRVGSLTAQTKAEIDATDVTLQQLQNQRGSISGVSIDEESANLIRYQHAFQAAARVVSVIDEMTRTILQMTS